MLNTDCDSDHFMIKFCDICHEGAPIDTHLVNTSYVDTLTKPYNQWSHRPSYSHTLDICTWDQNSGDIHSEATTPYPYPQFLGIPP